jgi:hypothetical protein
MSSQPLSADRWRSPVNKPFLGGEQESKGCELNPHAGSRGEGRAPVGGVLAVMSDAVVAFLIPKGSSRTPSDAVCHFLRRAWRSRYLR